MQFSALAAGYLKALNGYKQFSPRTSECYELAYAQFRGFLQQQGKTDDVRHFDPDTCEAFAQSLLDGGMKGNSVRVKLAALSSLAGHGMKQKAGASSKGYVLADNPLKRFEWPRKQRVGRKFLHRDELNAVRDVACPDNEALVRDLFLDTGCRVSELVNANVEDLGLDSKERVFLSVSVKGRSRSEEKVPTSLDAALAERLIAAVRLREAKGKEPLLVNQAGHRYTRSAMYELIRRTAERAGVTRLHVGPHTLRHSYNNLGRQAGLDVPTRAAMLNHTDTATVQKYDHLMPEETYAGREAVRAVLRG